MKIEIFKIFVLILLASCSNKKSVTEVSAKPKNTTTTPTVTSTTTPFVQSLSLTASVYSVAPLGSVDVYAQGGAGSYFYYVSSGSATINSSTGLFKAGSSSGSVEIGVEDANGTTAYLTIDVTSATATDEEVCGTVALGTSSVIQSDVGVQESIDLARYTYLSGFVITGVGLRFVANRAIGLYARVSKFESNGNVNASDSYAYRTGDLGSTDKGELYLQLPANYFLVGIGAAPSSNGVDVETIKLYAAKVDNFGMPTSTLECLVDRNGTSGCAASKVIRSALSARYKEFKGSANRPLTGFGMGLNSKSINALWIKSAAIQGSANSCAY